MRCMVVVVLSCSFWHPLWTHVRKVPQSDALICLSPLVVVWVWCPCVCLMCFYFLMLDEFGFEFGLSSTCLDCRPGVTASVVWTLRINPNLSDSLKRFVGFQSGFKAFNKLIDANGKVSRLCPAWVVGFWFIEKTIFYSTFLTVSSLS